MTLNAELLRLPPPLRCRLPCAQATDIANAVLDGVDGFLLGAETVRPVTSSLHYAPSGHEGHCAFGGLPSCANTTPPLSCAGRNCADQPASPPAVPRSVSACCAPDGPGHLSRS